MGHIEETTRDILFRLSYKSDVTPETHLINDVGFDSLDIVEMVIELENKFSIKIPDEDTDDILHGGNCRVKDVAKYIASRLR